MMKKLFMGAAMALGMTGAALADPAEGLWKTQPGETGGYLHVAIAACGSALCGTINAAYDKDGKKQATYDHLGKTMLKGMGSDGGGSYSGGTVWAPDSDKTYKSKMELSGNSLEVKGCVAGGLICRGQTWKRVN